MVHQRSRPDIRTLFLEIRKLKWEEVNQIDVGLDFLNFFEKSVDCIVRLLQPTEQRHALSRRSTVIGRNELLFQQR